MAEQSMFWTTGVAGDGLNKYDFNRWIDLWRSLLIGNYLSSYGWGGVVPNPVANNHLEVSGVATPLAIEKGWANVYGFPYQLTADTTLAVPTPAIGTTGKCVVLRSTWLTREVRITLLTSADGTAAIPAIVQTPGTTYDIKLADLTVTTLGVISVTDQRRFLGFASNFHRLHQNGDINDNLGVAGGSTGIPIRATTFFQTGVKNWTGGSATSGSVTVTFPEVYSTIPVVFVTPLSASDVKVRAVPTASNFALSWTATAAKTTIDFMWIALGFIGTNS